MRKGAKRQSIRPARSGSVLTSTMAAMDVAGEGLSSSHAHVVERIAQRNDRERKRIEQKAKRSVSDTPVRAQNRPGIYGIDESGSAIDM